MAVPDDRDWSRDTGSTSAPGTSTWDLGTGYFLERAGLPEGSPVTLLDPNTNVLDHATRRLQRLDITTVEADVCKPLPIDWTVRLRRAERRDPLPAGTALPQGRGDRQRGCRPRTDWRALRRIDPRDLRTTHAVGTERARRQQPAGRLRQPRRTRRRGSARSSGHRSNRWTSRRSARSRSSRPRIRARTRPMSRHSNDR